MGFRSTMITEDLHVPLSKKFVQKYSKIFNFGIDNDKQKNFPISSKFEMKTYFDTYQEMVTDLAILAKEHNVDFSAVFLHECGGLTKVDFHADGTYVCGIPTGWETVGVNELEIGHDYCYGCSNLSVPQKITVTKKR